MCLRLDKQGFFGTGIEIGALNSLNFHMGEGKKEVKQISVLDSSKIKYRVTHLDKEHFIKEPTMNYSKTENFKIPSGYIVVGARIPKKADLYSHDSVPICDLIIMKEQGSA